MIRFEMIRPIVALLTVVMLASACGGTDGSVADSGEAEPTALAEEPIADPEAEESTADAEVEADPEPGTEPESDAEPEPAADSVAIPPVGEGALADAGAFASLASTRCPFDSSTMSVDPACYELTVPADWDNPDDGETVTIMAAMFSGGGTGDPVIYFDGGPGVATLELAGFSYATLIEPYVADHDYIIFDQRGVGFSEPSLACDESNEFFLDSLAVDRPLEELIELNSQAEVECRDRLIGAGVQLDEYNSINSANDVEALRQSLDLGPLNIIGVSYGSRLANSFMRMYPESVRAVVLDGNLPTGADLWTNFGRGAERAFNVLFDECAASSSCSTSFPDFEARYFELLDQLDAEPVTLAVRNALTGSMHDVVLGGDTVANLTFAALYGKPLFSLIPEGVELAFEGDYSAWELLASVQLAQSSFVSLGQQLSVECNEEIAFESAEEHAANKPENPRWAALDEPSLFTSCEQWPAGVAPDVENEPVVSDLPALVLSGQYDPITPPSYGDQVAATLENSFVFTLPHEGHGVSTTPCGSSIVLDFFAAPAAEPDSSCIGDIEPPAWVPTVDDGSGVTLVEFEVGDGRTSLRPEGWTEQGQGVFARANDALDPTLMIIQAHGGGSIAELQGIISGQFNAELTEGDRLSVDGVEWATLAGTSDFGEIRAAFSGGTDGMLVLLLGAAEEIDGLVENISLPVISNLSNS